MCYQSCRGVSRISVHHVACPGVKPAAMAGEVLARHHRSLAKHRTITDPIHIAQRDTLRVVATIDGRNDREVEVRDLASYDRVLGVA